MTETDRIAPAGGVADTSRSQRLPWLVAGALALVCTFGAGYLARDALAPAPEPSPTPGLEITEPAAAVARDVMPSTVLIRAGVASGSGFIYNDDGRIFTAAHLVGGRDKVTVRLADGTQLDADVLGADASRDVAVVKVSHKDLRPAKLARGVQVHVGELTVAIGSPFGQRETITAGVVSGIGRTFSTARGSVDAIMTDALVNPGNSGGPLADRQGRVIGINVATRNDLGIAIPIDVALETAKFLERGEDPPAVAFLGVSSSDPTDARTGALITEIRPGSAADDAGIEPGDLITHIDGEPVTGMFELGAAIRKHVPGDEIEFTLTRDGRSRKIKVKLGSFES